MKQVALILLVSLTVRAGALGVQGFSSGPSGQGQLSIALSDGMLFLPEVLDPVRAERTCGTLAARSAGPKEPAAAIGPHHLPFGAPVLFSLYERLSQTASLVTRIIILGPDHQDAGTGPIISEAVTYQTSLGSTASDEQFILDLAAAGLITRDNAPLVTEHSIYSQVPFIQRFFPDAAIVPVLFRSDASSVDAAALGHYLADRTGQETLVILSTDLSHYRSRSEAEIEDTETVQILRALRSSRLMAATFDARPAARALFAYLERKGVTLGAVLCQANSADFGADAGSTTGYAGIVY